MASIKQHRLDRDPKRNTALSPAVPAHLSNIGFRGLLGSALSCVGFTINPTLFKQQRLAHVLVCATLLLIAGCDSQSDVEKAAAVAAEIKKAPKKAETILKEHDMTIEEFEKLMYDVAADPEKAKEFEEASKKKK